MYLQLKVKGGTKVVSIDDGFLEKDWRGIVHDGPWKKETRPGWHEVPYAPRVWSFDFCKFKQ